MRPPNAKNKKSVLTKTRLDNSIYHQLSKFKYEKKKIKTKTL